jgi:hypothetical protein
MLPHDWNLLKNAQRLEWVVLLNLMMDRIVNMRTGSLWERFPEQSAAFRRQ